jgi:hypothetical protein
MEAGIVQRIFRDHFAAYQREHPVGARERWAAWNILTCRTPAQGFHVDACPTGDYRVLLHNSCKHRSCPQCGATETELWLERRRLQALACPYFHIVFTLSHALHAIWRRNRTRFTDVMFQAAWHTLRELLGDGRWLGALPGAIGVFQSWGDELQDHCHLHVIVTAGGLTGDGRWVDVDPAFLLPTAVVAAKFRGKFLAYLREGLETVRTRGKGKPEAQAVVPPAGRSVQQCRNLLNKLGRIKWHVEIDPAYAQATGVYKYVGRYLRRGPISEARIVAYDGDRLTIAYAHPEKHTQRTFSLTAETFIQRLLSHVPAKGTHVVRAYGLFHPNCRGKLDDARAQLDQPAYEPLTELPPAHELLLRMFPDWAGNRCPRCGAVLQTVYVSHRAQAPPLQRAA